jgi:hypothetical protein
VSSANDHRNNYAAAKLQGLETDLKLDDTKYQTGLSVLFVGYILMQVPSNLLLNYMGRPSIYIGFFVCAWGLVSALTSQVSSYGGIVACRFILGIVGKYRAFFSLSTYAKAKSEAPFFSGVLFYLSKWYTKRELAFRMSIFYSGSLLSGAFGNLIAAGILHGLKGKRGLSAWQWLYVIEGSITCAIGLAICFILPDFPETWKLLSPEMRKVAQRRLAIEAGEADVDEKGGANQLKGLKLAMTDVKTYVFALGYMCITGAAGFQNFFPTLVKSSLNYSETISLVLVAPPYLFMVAYSLGHSWTSDKLEKRFWFFIYPIPITIIGFVVYMKTNTFGPRYFSFFLMVFVFAQNGTIYSWLASSLPRPPAKRAAGKLPLIPLVFITPHKRLTKIAFAFFNSLGNSASIWTPYTYIAKEAPHYQTAMGVCIALQVVGGLCALFLYFNLNMLNKRQLRLENEEVELSPKDLRRLQVTADVEGIDLAAARRLQKGFRYVL